MAQTQDVKWIKNTFAPNCKNEYFNADTLFGIIRAGFGYDNLPPDAQALVRPKMEAFLADPSRKDTGPDYLAQARERLAKKRAAEAKRRQRP